MVVAQLAGFATLATVNAIRSVEITLATTAELREAYAIVSEYYQAALVVQRETFAEFESAYFSERAGLWLARAAERTAGCIALHPLHLSASAEIKRLYVRQEWRGRGVAQQLLDAAEHFAKSSGYEWIYLDTASEMAAAARLYEKNGYQRCDRYNDNPQAAIFMRKSLRGV